jgi:phage gpG-like protein
MKKLMSITVMVLLGIALGPLSAISGEQHMGAPIAHSRDFEKMKELVGVWEGNADMGRGMESIKTTYELTSAGNAVLERAFAGSPHEMVTVYHDFGGKLTMTHYCSLGNQPHMELKNSGEKTLGFVLSEKNHGLSSVTETHMHALKIAFDGKDSITQTWTLYEKGARKSDVVIKLNRAKL